MPIQKAERTAKYPNYAKNPILSRGSRGSRFKKKFLRRGFGSSSRLDREWGKGYFANMHFGLAFEEIKDEDFPPGYFYAHLPSLGLTTHGLGLDGARQAALDLARVWLAEKKAQGDPLPAASELLFSTLDVPDDALQSA